MKLVKLDLDQFKLNNKYPFLIALSIELGHFTEKDIFSIEFDEEGGAIFVKTHDKKCFLL
jgi:hypothetical protein